MRFSAAFFLAFCAEKSQHKKEVRVRYRPVPWWLSWQQSGTFSRSLFCSCQCSLAPLETSSSIWLCFFTFLPLKELKSQCSLQGKLQLNFQFLPKRECLNIKSQENSFWSVKNVARSLADTFSWFCCPYLVNAILTAKTWIRCQTCRILLYKCQAFLIKSKSVLRC